ncbi:helix-turn-helix domain-containing protein [Hydrogenophaga sp.]|uniref:GlxA family transcriptional regulator n=1 Tax=Hydrogenophaga sp. TaxID=1904254 RepID=UPI002C9F4135|nr:helix-turn-helix domain-containing protein [Hydrogenophaga sp.]HMP09504.1 helix-turn-helix domain-containing protein [Hydrogenophaga sp.]
MKPRGAVKIAILAPEHALGWTIMGPADMLRAAGSLWAGLEGRERAEGDFEVEVVGRTGQPVSCFMGARLLPEVSLDDPLYRPDVVIVPAMFEESVRFGRSGWSAPWTPFVQWIARQHERGAMVVGISTGVALLAETGLLDGRDATTHWAMLDAMAGNYRRVNFLRTAQVQPAGAGSRLLTTAGGTAWQSMVLLLVARFSGGEHAVELARLFATTWPTLTSPGFSAFLPATDHGDAQVSRAQRHIASHFAEADCLIAAAAYARLSRRTFERRFRAATGYSPLAYLQEVRMQRARVLLESTPNSVESVAVTVGYSDLPHFRTLFNRMCGSTPSRYRELYGYLAQVQMTLATI